MDDDEFVGDSEEETEVDHLEDPIAGVFHTAMTLAGTDVLLGVSGVENYGVNADLPELLRDTHEATPVPEAPSSSSTDVPSVEPVIANTVAAALSDTGGERPPEPPVNEVVPVEEWLVKAVESDAFAQDHEAELVEAPRAIFSVGETVHVAARTWPGINKLGGAGKIAAIISEVGADGSVEYLYNVKYMLGGFEKRIEEEFIQDLGSALETGARPLKERVFYHKEFAEVRSKKQKLDQAEDNSTAPAEEARVVKSGADAIPIAPQTKKKRTAVQVDLVDAPEIPFKARSSDDSDYELAEDEDELGDDEVQSTAGNKLDEKAFILDERRIAAVRKRKLQNQGSSEGEATRKRDLDRDRRRAERRAKRRRRRLNRIVASDDEESNEEEQHHRKKRYVGGYAHGAGDADGTFIQPEGNTDELPEDVAKELQFELGKTKAELRHQLDIVVDRLTANLREFETRRSTANRDLASFANDVDELRRINTTLLDLGDFVRSKLIRSGEDVINQIITVLERKGGRLPDAIALQIDQWAGQISDHDSWVKQSLRALEKTFTRRGVISTFRREHTHVPDRVAEPTSPGSSSDFEYSDQGDYGAIEVSDTSEVEELPRIRSRSDRDSRKRRQRSLVSKKRPRQRQRQLLPTQASLDDFTVPLDEARRWQRFENDSTPILKNFRVAGTQNQLLLSDPRWDWARKLKAPSSSSRDRQGSGVVAARSQSASSRTNTRETRGSGSVMEALMRLREKRFRARGKVSGGGSSKAPLQSSASFFDVGARSQLLPAVVATNASYRDQSHRSSQHPAPSARRTSEGTGTQPVASYDSWEPSAIQGEAHDWFEIFQPVCRDAILPPTADSFRGRFTHIGDYFLHDNGGSSSDEVIVDCTQDIIKLMSGVRQRLNHLRERESEAILLIYDVKMDPETGVDLDSITAWPTAVELGNVYHQELIGVVSAVRYIAESAHSTHALQLVEAMIAELCASTQQIPDCRTVLSATPEYAYFFEVAASGFRSTPIITAICRTYWYVLQCVILLKKCCESRLQSSKVEWSVLFVSTLPPNRVALASCLFLVDLALHVPSAHRFNEPAQESIQPRFEDADYPALSLWLLLHQLFAEGSLQSTKGSDGDNSTLWNFLQTTYRQHFVDDIGIRFTSGVGSGGYLRDRGPTISSAVDASDSCIQGKILAADTLWDLCGLLASVFKTVNIPGAPATKSSPPWSLVKELLQVGDPDSMPLNQLNEKHKADDEFKVQAYGFKLRIMRRLLVLSTIWTPENDVMERVVNHLWHTTYDEEGGDAVASALGFVGELCTVSTNPGEKTLFDLAKDHAENTTSFLALFCKITVVQLSKLEKVIHRSRYRQPILRALSTRQELHKSLLVTPIAEKAPVTVNETSGKEVTWNWGKRDGKASIQSSSATVASKANPSQPSTPTPAQIVSEVKQMLSILLVFGLSSIYLDQPRGEDVGALARRQKELTREIDFFCKEFSAVSRNTPESSEQLCECLHAIGTAAIDLKTSYSAVFEAASAALKHATSEHERYHKDKQDTPGRKQSRLEESTGAAISACLRVLRDLSIQLTSRVRKAIDVDPSEIRMLRSCASAVFCDGIGYCLDAAVEGTLRSSDLSTTIEIVALWIPRAKHTPTRSLVVAPLMSAQSAQSSEFDEFDDDEMMDLLATVDLENGTLSGTVDHHTIAREIEEYANGIVTANLRLPIQRLVMSMPSMLWRSYQEIYLLDVFGAMVASCTFPFSWSIVSRSAMKQRLLAPRLLSSTLKVKSEKDWFATIFLSEQNADAELSSMWLLATLDVKSLLPVDLRFPPDAGTNDNRDVGVARYSDYWLALTDGILANMLKENQVVRYKMDPLIHKLLADTSAHCSYRRALQENPEVWHISSLTSLHADVFRTFCRRAGMIWQELSEDPSRRGDLNRFRSKIMDKQRGILTALPEAYEINLQLVCAELDRESSNRWLGLTNRFLEDFSPRVGDTESLHSVDDASSALDRDLTDPVLRPLVVLFKFMYECVDAFLFNCGGMAIGQQNIFYSVIELMFRQARCAESQTAEERLKRSSMSTSGLPFDARVVLGTSGSSTVPGVSNACSSFAESVRLFFAYQKYPSLVNWFVQNLETYQTLKGGWNSSPLRVLAYNILDPYGPLGIHSYYPIQDKQDRFDPGHVRREAFYLSCGLYRCCCSTAYEHSRQEADHHQEHRRAQLRRFMVTAFISELIGSVKEDEDIDETVLPAMQFVKATLGHANLGNADQLQMLVWEDLGRCLCAIGQHILHKLKEDHRMGETMTCVLMIEFSRIVEEAVRLHDILQNGKLRRFVDIGLQVTTLAYRALGQYSSIPVEEIFTRPDPSIDSLLESLQDLHRGEQLFQSKRGPSSLRKAAAEDFGISMVRVRTDLLTTIRHVAKYCKSVRGFEGFFECSQAASVRSIDTMDTNCREPVPDHTSVLGTM